LFAGAARTGLCAARCHAAAANRVPPKHHAAVAREGRGAVESAYGRRADALGAGKKKPSRRLLRDGWAKPLPDREESGRVLETRGSGKGFLCSLAHIQRIERIDIVAVRDV